MSDPEPHDLQFQIDRQPDDVTCGATCLHAVYRYFGDSFALDDLMAEVPTLEQGGTLGVLLANHALLRVRLETGRTHQIRVHLAAIDLPVSGDPVYGVTGDLGLERQFLHAERLAFTHPVTGDPVDLRSPLPADLATALERARRV